MLDIENGFDLVDQMQWEDLIEFESLESAGLIDGYNDDTVPGEVYANYYSEES